MKINPNCPTCKGTGYQPLDGTNGLAQGTCEQCAAEFAVNEIARIIVRDTFGLHNDELIPKVAHVIRRELELAELTIKFNSGVKS